jgi:hypothetical protein
MKPREQRETGEPSTVDVTIRTALASITDSRSTGSPSYSLKQNVRRKLLPRRRPVRSWTAVMRGLPSGSTRKEKADPSRSA